RCRDMVAGSGARHSVGESGGERVGKTADTRALQRVNRACVQLASVCVLPMTTTRTTTATAAILPALIIEPDAGRSQHRQHSGIVQCGRASLRPTGSTLRAAGLPPGPATPTTAGASGTQLPPMSVPIARQSAAGC